MKYETPIRHVSWKFKNGPRGHYDFGNRYMLFEHSAMNIR